MSGCSSLKTLGPKSLARDTIWYIHAARRRLPTRDADIRPRPVPAAANTALDQHIHRVTENRARHVLQHEIGDRDAVGRLSINAVVALVDDDAIVGAA